MVRYRKLFIPFALLAMAVHRLPMRWQRGCSFWKLLGSGKNGTFDLHPDWQQWGILACWDSQDDFDNFYERSFISKWWRFFRVEKWTLLCEPLQSHGKWDGKEPFDNIEIENYNGPVAILTRATIRFNRLKNFWANVDIAARSMNNSQGFITSFGVGEMPFYRQATFSVWESLDDAKKFAYGSKEHVDVIKKTREENWYSEELFARFKPIASIGALNQVDPIGLLHMSFEEKTKS